MAIRSFCMPFCTRTTSRSCLGSPRHARPKRRDFAVPPCPIVWQRAFVSGVSTPRPGDGQIGRGGFLQRSAQAASARGWYFQCGQYRVAAALAVPLPRCLDERALENTVERTGGGRVATVDRCCEYGCATAARYHTARRTTATTDSPICPVDGHSDYFVRHAVLGADDSSPAAAAAVGVCPFVGGWARCWC